MKMIMCFRFIQKENQSNEYGSNSFCKKSNSQASDETQSNKENLLDSNNIIDTYDSSNAGASSSEKQATKVNRYRLMP